MRTFLTLLVFTPCVLSAQTTFEVEVGGSLGTPNNLPYYEPMDLTIEVGDIVEWTSVGGSHNVYAGLDVFPDNPDAFGNGNAAQAPWTFSHTFNAPGVWDYHCTVTFQGQAHATTQFGTITVLGPNGVRPIATNKAVALYPNPADDVLMLALNGCTGATRVTILSAGGLQLRSQFVQDDRVNEIDVKGLPSGQYFLMMDRGRRNTLLPFVKQ